MLFFVDHRQVIHSSTDSLPAQSRVSKSEMLKPQPASQAIVEEEPSNYMPEIASLEVLFLE